MAVKKITGDPEIDAVINSIHKQFSKDNLISFGITKEPVRPIPTGSLALDVATGIGGLPEGRIIEIFGPESSGKTSLCLKIVASYLQHREVLGHEGRKPLIVDVEHTMAIDLIEGVGLDPDEMIYSRPDTAEEALQTLENLIKTGKIGIALLDSVDGLQGISQLKKQVGDVHMGGVSKLMSESLRKLSKLCAKTNTTLIFINQIRQNPGEAYGSPIVTPGGNALKFYSSLRLQTMKAKPSPNLSNAMQMRIKLIKNKCSAPRSGEIAFDFIYAKGPDPALDTIATAKDLGLAYFAGQNLMVKWEGLDASGEKLAQGGAAGAAAVLRENPELLSKLRQLCIDISGASAPAIESDDDQEEEEE